MRLPTSYTFLHLPTPSICSSPSPVAAMSLGATWLTPAVSCHVSGASISPASTTRVCPTAAWPPTRWVISPYLPPSPAFSRLITPSHAVSRFLTPSHTSLHLLRPPTRWGRRCRPASPPSPPSRAPSITATSRRVIPPYLPPSPAFSRLLPPSHAFHHGYEQAPYEKVPLLDIHGYSDRQVPCNSSDSTSKALSQDGWWYQLLALTQAGWTEANGCGASTKPSNYVPPLLSSSARSKNNLGCVEHTARATRAHGGWCKVTHSATSLTPHPPAPSLVPRVRCVEHGCDTVTCAWDGAHTYFGSTSRENGQLVWGFLSTYAPLLTCPW